MNNKLWWLWEGAAVRFYKDRTQAGIIVGISEDSDWLFVQDSVSNKPLGMSSSLVTPIENPAVMLAPGLATHVEINGAGWCHYTSVDHDPFVIDRDFLWPQCPDHLKGHTWELPHE